MLTRIEIKDFALIEHVVIEPTGGLLIISGETGAGKSILIDAIGALTGNRISREMIRFGQDNASIEAVFSHAKALLPDEWTETLGISDDDDELILSREINSQGKNVCRVNGRLVNQSVLKQTVKYLIDIHGQNDQQTIFQQETHLLLLDRFGGTAVSQTMDVWQKQLDEVMQIKRSLRELGSDPAERARQIDLLNYQVNEIESARIRPQEDEKLQKRKKILASLERIQEGLNTAAALLDDDSHDSVSARLAMAGNQLEFAARFSDEIRQCHQGLMDSLDQISTHAADLRALTDKYQAQPDELEKTEQRLDLFYNLKKKYGGSLEAVLVYYEKAKERLALLLNSEAVFETLNNRLEESLGQLADAGHRLYQVRKQAAGELETRVAEELAELGMKGVRFAVQLDHSDPTIQSPAKNGMDKAAFQISANAGEPMKPLVRIASGGEASRVLLAIKTILADADNIPVLIFDEIDTGVSGHTAGMVAEKLKQIAAHRQVFCITHMAQIAAMADQHILIEKVTDGQTTRTQLNDLNRLERQAELARLLSGGVAVDTASELAGRMLEQ